jgi:hypothetical protein
MLSAPVDNTENVDEKTIVPELIVTAPLPLVDNAPLNVVVPPVAETVIDPAIDSGGTIVADADGDTVSDLPDGIFSGLHPPLTPACTVTASPTVGHASNVTEPWNVVPVLMLKLVPVRTFTALLGPKYTVPPFRFTVLPVPEVSTFPLNVGVPLDTASVPTIDSASPIVAVPDGETVSVLPDDTVSRLHVPDTFD